MSAAPVAVDPMAFLPLELQRYIWSFVAPLVRTRALHVARLRNLSGLAAFSTRWYRLVVDEMSSFQARFVLFPPLLGLVEVGGLLTLLNPCPLLPTRACRSGIIVSYDLIADVYDVQWLSEQPHDATGTPLGPRIALNSSRSKPAAELNREVSSGKVAFTRRGGSALLVSRPHLLSPVLGGVVPADGP